MFRKLTYMWCTEVNANNSPLLIVEGNDQVVFQVGFPVGAGSTMGQEQQKQCPGF